MDRPLRRPVRAFFVTPILFIFIYGSSFFLMSLSVAEISNPLETVIDGLSYFGILMFYGLPITYLATLLIGFPIYFFIKKSKFETALFCVLATAVIASFVYFLLEVDIFLPTEGHSFSYGDSGGPIIQDNVRTAYGWRKLFFGMSQIFVLAAISGLMFWRLYSGKWWGKIAPQ